MNRTEALAGLESKDLSVRLASARTLSQAALPQDITQLQAALAKESVRWVKDALKKAIQKTSPTQPIIDLPTSDESMVSPDVYDQIKAIAVNETTRRLVHEIAPILGMISVHARDEITNFAGSRTRTDIERFRSLLDAFNTLSQAAVAPRLDEMDLSSTIADIAETESEGHSVKVSLAGQRPIMIVGDAALLRFVIGNGLRNAIEATESAPARQGELQAVTITWGTTDRDVWITILDQGPGPPISADRAFDIGNTTKPDHLGMGLAIARQAAESMSGTLLLAPRESHGGARFEFRWPILTDTK